MEKPGMFRQTPGVIRRGISETAENATPSPRSGFAAPIETPVWRSFVGHSEFQKTNREAVDDEQRRLRDAETERRSEERAIERGPKWKGGIGRLSVTHPDGTIEEHDAEGFLDDPVVGRLAAESVFKRDLKAAKDDADSLGLKLADPSDARGLTPKQRADIEAEGSMLPETDPRHVELKGRLKADDDRKADEQKAYQAKVRLQEFSRGGVDAWLQRRQSAKPIAEKQAEVARRSEELDAAELSATQELQAIDEKMATGVRGTELPVLQQRRAEVVAAQEQITAERAVPAAQAKQVAAQSRKVADAMDGKPSVPLADRLEKAITETGLFPGMTDALTTAWDKRLEKGPDGKWLSPNMASAPSGNPVDGLVGGLMSLAGKFGDQNNVLDPILSGLQQREGFTDAEIQSAWDDLGQRYRKWEDGEKARVTSDGQLLPNTSDTDWLDETKAKAIINGSTASAESKAQALANLPRIQEAIASQRAQELTIASAARVFGDSVPMFPLYAEHTGGTVIDQVKGFEAKYLHSRGPIRRQFDEWRAANLAGQLKLGQTALGIGGLLGSETMGETAASVSQGTALLKQGAGVDGLLSAAIEEAPSMFVQIALTRGMGAGVGAVTGSARAAGAAGTLGAFATAGAQSAGITYAGELAAGATPEDARAKAAKAGVNTALITAAFGAGSLGGVERVAAGRAAEMTVRDLWTLARQKGVTSLAKSPELRKFAGAVVKSAGGEAAEEGLDELLGAFLTADPDSNLSDAWSNAIEAAKVGGFIGGAVDVGSGVLEKDSKWQAQTVQSTPEDRAARVNAEMTAADPAAVPATPEEIAAAEEVVGVFGAGRDSVELEDKIALAEGAEADELRDQRGTTAAREVAAGIQINRELEAAEAADQQAVEEAEANLQAVRGAAVDQAQIEQAEAEVVEAKAIAASVPRARGVLKLSRGENLETLTDAEVRALGVTRDGKPLKEEELASVGLEKPLVELGADGSPVILDEALKELEAVSPTARDRVKMTESQARKKAVDRAQGDKAGGESTMAPGNFTVTGRAGTVVEVQAADESAAEEAGALALPMGEQVESVSSQAAPQTTANPANHPQSREEKAAKDIEGAFAGMSGAITGNFYKGIEDSLRSKGEVPSAEAKSRIGQAWKMVRDKYGATPDSIDRFMTAVEAVGKKHGDTSEGWTKALNESFRGAQAASTADVSKLAPTIKKRIARWKQRLGADMTVTDDPAARATATDAGVVINPSRLVDEATANGLDGAQAEAWVQSVIDEEVRHFAHLKAAREIWKRDGTKKDFEAWRTEYYGMMWAEEFAGERGETVRALYGASFDALEDWQKAMEGLRMMSQKLATGSPTEVAKLWTNAGPRIINAIREALKALKAMVADLSPALQAEIAAIEAQLSKYEQGSTTVPDRPTKPAPVRPPRGNGKAAGAGGKAPDARDAAADRSGGVSPASDRVEFERDGERVSGVALKTSTDGSKTLVRTDTGNVLVPTDKLIRQPAEATPAGPDLTTAEDDATKKDRMFEWLVEGKSDRDGWFSFSAQSGTLGIPRAEMPQIAADDRSAMVQFLRARGIDYTDGRMLPTALKPTQAEFSAAKVDKARAYVGGDRAILVSADGYLVDGHHQWLAKWFDAPAEPMRTIRLEAPIRDILEALKEMPSVETAEGGRSVATIDNPLPQPTAADWNTREKLVGEDFAGTPNSIVIQLRNPNSVPLPGVLPIVIPLGRDMVSTVDAAAAAFFPAAEEHDASFRESVIKLIGPDGRAFAALASRGPGKLEAARQDDLERAREVLRDWQKEYDRQNAGNVVPNRPSAGAPAPATPALENGVEETPQGAWTPERQAEYKKLKSALTKAEKSGDPEKLLAEAERGLSRFEATGAYPDDWSRWERAKDDATLAISRKPKLSAGEQSLKDAFKGLVDGLEAASLSPEDFRKGIPPERIGQFITAAQSMIAEGVKTPEGLAAALDKISDKLRPYSEAVWSAFRMVDPSLPSQVDWVTIYTPVDKAPEQEQPASDDSPSPSSPRSEGPPASGGVERGTGGSTMDSESGGKTAGAGDPEQLSDDGGGTGSGGDSGTVGGNAPRSGSGRGKSELLRGDGSERGGKPSADGTGSVESGDGSGVAGGKQPARPGYRLTDPERIIGTGGPKTRFARNKLALETFDTVFSEGRDPTPEEADRMAAYIGWGSFGQELFQGSWDRPNPKPEWKEESDWLRDHLGKEGWQSIQASIINAHYTDPPHVAALWRIAEHLGFKGGRVLEPSMGIGTFFGLMPDVLRAKSSLTGIELDRVVGGMAKMLYPDANIRIMGYEKSSTADGFYDLVIGNWPFAKDGPSDSRYNALGLSLHDYFFVKALDQTRPGGLVIGITSSGTMDKKGQVARRQMARRAKLIAAFRFPTGAFEKYAGTKVVTDVLILQKRDEAIGSVESEEWITGEEFGTSGQTFHANSYWKKHPDHVLGTMTYGHGTTQGRAGMIVERGADYAERLARIQDALPKDILTEPGTKPAPVYQNRQERSEQNSVQWEDGKNGTPEGFYIVRGEQLEPLHAVFKWAVKNPKAKEKRASELRALLAIRDSVRALLDAQRDGSADAGKLRSEAKANYDAFVKAHGSLADSFMVQALVKAGDPMALTLKNLERMENGKPVPRDILLKDIMRRPKVDAQGDIGDAYAIQRNQSVDLDLDAIAKTAGKPVDEVISRLVGMDQIFKTPTGVWESREEYLGGNVRRKLREARAAQEEGLDMDRNIAALEAVQPKDVAYFEIEVQMGASWITRDDYLGFVSHLLGADPGMAEMNFDLVKAHSGWNFKVKSEQLKRSTQATATWGTDRVPFSKVFQAAMNAMPLKVYDTDPETKAKILNSAATQLVNQKVDSIREEISNWLWADPERAGRLARDYNEVRNSEVVPKRNGNHLRFEGLSLTMGSSEFDFRQHQKDAVWRFIMDGRGVGAHEVGTGKTFTMAGLAVEGRRLGVFRKSLVFAHNANAESVFRDFQAAYPSGRFLYIDNLKPENRDNAMRQIATDEWDAVIVPHSLIDRFALREETLTMIAAKEIEQLESEISDAFDELNLNIPASEWDDEKALNKRLARTKDAYTAKELVKARNRILKRIADKAAKAAKDNAVFFEDLGVDSIIVDEAHIFKKINLATRKNVKGLNKTESDRGWALGALTDTIKAKNNGKGVFLFTGTPLTNNLNEAYNMMRFVMDDAMSDSGIDNFDDWFNSFAASVTDVELTTGGTYEPVNRLLSFINVPELARLAGRYFDVVQAKDMPEFIPRDSEDGKSPDAVGRPFKKIRIITSEMTPAQKSHKESIQERYKWFQSLSGKAKKAAMEAGVNTPIQLEGEGVKAALDMRLVDHGAPDDPNSKVNRMLENALAHYREDDKSTQMIFMERGWNDYTDAEVKERDAEGKVRRDDEGKAFTRKERRPQFNLVRDMVEKLVAQGIPPEEIAVFSNMSLDPLAQRPDDVLRRVHKVTGKVSKEDLAEMMRVGKIRFAFGGTQTMGTGVNAQTHMRAMHHLDAPWTPGEFEQRNGRGHRQGNEWNTVFEYRYFTEGSHDGRRWQVLLNKVKFITRFTEMLKDAGGSNLRVLSGDGADLGEGGENVADFEQSFSTAAGDPRVLVRAKLKGDVDKLQRKKDAHHQAVSRAGRDIRELEAKKVRDAVRIARGEKLLQVIEANREKPFQFSISGKTFAERKDAEEFLAAFPSLTSKDDGKVVARLNDVEIFHRWDRSNQIEPSAFYARVPIEGQDSESFLLGKFSIASIEATLRSQARMVAILKEQFATIDASIQSLAEMASKPFTRQAELDAKTNSLEQIQVELARAPQPAPAWLRNGAPVGSLVTLADGKAYDVGAHRWDANGYWILIEDGEGLRPLDYRKALDDAGQPMFEEVAFEAPPNAELDEGAVREALGDRFSLVKPGSRSVIFDNAHADVIPSDKWRIFTQGFITTAEGKTPGEAYNRHLQWQENGDDGASLRAAPLRADDEEWKKMPPAARKAYLKARKSGLHAAPLGDGETAANTARLILKGRAGMAGADVEREARDQQAAFADQGKVVGRPDLANISEDEAVRAEMDIVDEMRKFTQTREKKAAWEREGRRLADTDESAVVEKWLQNAYSDEGQAVRPEDVVAARVVMERRVKAAGNDLAKHAENAVLLHGYREARANQARVLAAGTDPFKKPEERHRDYLAGVLYSLPPRVVSEIEDRSKSPAAARAAIRKAVEERLGKIEAALKKMGVTLDEITGGQVFLSMSQAQVMKDAVAKLSPAERSAVKAIQSGATLADIRKRTGLPEAKIQKLATDLRRQLADKLRAKVAAGMKLEDLRDELKGLHAAALSEADIEAELDRILTVGFGIPKEIPTTRLPKRRRVVIDEDEDIDDTTKAARRVARLWIDRLSVSQSDTLKWNNPKKRSELELLIRAHLDKPVPGFIEKAQALGATAEQARVLDGEATTERHRREMIRKWRKDNPKPRKKTTKPVPLEKQNWSRPTFTDGLAAYEFDTADRSEIMARVTALRDVTGAPGRIDVLEGKKKAQAVRLIGEMNRILAKYGTSADNIMRDGTDPDSYRFDISDRRHVMILARTIQALDADIVDKATEIYYSSLLSGLQTMIVNAAGGLNTIWQATVERGFEAAINLLVRDPEIATFGEIPHMLRAMKPMLARAWGNAAATWSAETPFFEEDILGRVPDMSRMEEGITGYKTASIGGLKGRIIRTPGRILMATDEFMNVARASAEVAAMAYRLARVTGLKPGTKEFDDFMKKEVNIAGSKSWQMAAQRALVGTFNNALPGQRNVNGKSEKISTLTDMVGGAIYGLTHAKWLRIEDEDGITKKILKSLPKLLFFPFVRVPFNILKQGIERSINPVSLADMALLLAHNLRIRNGKLTINADGDKVRIIEMIAKQAQGALLMLLLASLGEGDDDDLEKPLIVTGSRPFGETNKGERELAYRLGLGPYEISMRLPGGKRIGFSYGRIEPAATVLGGTVDTLRNAKAAARGRISKADALGSMLFGFVAQANDKTSLRGAADLMAILKNEKPLDRYAADRIASIVPNLIKQAVRESDPVFREKPTEFVEMLQRAAWPRGGPAAVDLYGEPQDKKGSDVGRVLDFTDFGTEKVRPWDEMLWRYRQKNPGDFYAPQTPMTTYEQGGKTVKMTPAQAARFKELAGLRTVALLKLQPFNLTEPTEADRKRFEATVTKARSEVKKALINSATWKTLN